MSNLELDQSFLEKLDLLGSWGVLATDQSLNVSFWNGWLEKHSGLTSADVIGRNLLELFPELVRRRMDRYFLQVLEGILSLFIAGFAQVPFADAANRWGCWPPVICSKQSDSCHVWNKELFTAAA